MIILRTFIPAIIKCTQMIIFCPVSILFLGWNTCTTTSELFHFIILSLRTLWILLCFLWSLKIFSLSIRWGCFLFYRSIIVFVKRLLNGFKIILDCSWTLFSKQSNRGSFSWFAFFLPFRSIKLSLNSLSKFLRCFMLCSIS